MGYLYHFMIILTIIWLWSAYVKMKEEKPDYTNDLKESLIMKKEVKVVEEAETNVGWLGGEEEEISEEIEEGGDDNHSSLI